MILRSAAAALLALGVVAAAAQTPTEPPKAVVATDTPTEAPAASSLDVGPCQACHESAFSKPFLKSYHAGLENACANCHQGAAEHSEGMQAGKDDVPSPSVAKLKAGEINEVCLTCHEKANHANWHGSAHDRRGVACTQCHSVHDPKSAKGQLRTAAEPDTCYGCHTAIRAQGLRTSHHPVREGLMTCSSCHDPHDGTKPKLIRADWTNELCLQCHTEKRGPFFWEHAPVRENCLNCHNPHGSNHDKLLVSQQPWLCQRCHLNTRHPGTFYSNLNAAGEATSASNRAVEHACKNCHQNVHGGNAPTAPYLGR